MFQQHIGIGRFYTLTILSDGTYDRALLLSTLRAWPAGRCRRTFVRSLASSTQSAKRTMAGVAVHLTPPVPSGLIPITQSPAITKSAHLQIF